MLSSYILKMVTEQTRYSCSVSNNTRRSIAAHSGNAWIDPAYLSFHIASRKVGIILYLESSIRAS